MNIAPFGVIYTRYHICGNDECCLNYEGDCMISLYEMCGTWEGIEV